MTSIHPTSIQFRVVAMGLGILIVTFIIQSYLAEAVLQRSLYREMESQQQFTAALQASYISAELNERFEALEAIAAKLPLALMADSAALQTHTRNYLDLLPLFNAGFMITGTDGTALAVPAHPDRIGVNYSDRDFFSTAINGADRTIGSPVIGKMLRAPLISLSVPIRHPDGAVLGVLAGGVDLSKPNFFDKITDNAYADSGYFLLVDRNSGLIITSTGKHRVMTKQAGAADNPLIKAHMQGQEVTGVTRNPEGIEVLATARNIPGTHWHVVAALPTDAALAPLQTFQRSVLLSSALILVLSSAFLFWGMRKLLAPLFNSISNIARLTEDNTLATSLPVNSNDEIGLLLQAFNHLLHQLRRQKDQLLDNEFRWKFAIEGAGDGLWDWNLSTNSVFYSPKWKVMLGLDSLAISDQLDEWKSRVHPEDLDPILAMIEKMIEGSCDHYASEHRLLRADGSIIWVLDRGLVVERDANNRATRIIGTISDITERRRLQDQVREMAFHDPLTALPNRRLLEEHLRLAIVGNTRLGTHSALILFDLDNFKPLNDRCGHAVGDLLLIEMATRLQQIVREADTVARIGGDEFVILINNLDRDPHHALTQARHIAEKIRDSVALPYYFTTGTDSGKPVQEQHQCSASIGLTLIEHQDKNIHTIIQRADEAMYRAKARGRNQVAL